VKLYSYFRSSAAYRVRIALNLKELSYTQAAVNLLKKEEKSPDFLEMNPQGRVPALDLGWTVLIQSPAILEYLEEIHPEPALLPRDAVERARVRAVCAIVGCDIHPLNNIGPLRYLKNVMGQDQAAIDTWYVHWIRDGFRAIEALIDAKPFAFGTTPTLADVYLVPQIYNARRFKISFDDYPRIAAVDAACSELEAFQAAAPERQPDAV
jgi:maleylacetoacetate isomerase